MARPPQDVVTDYHFPKAGVHVAGPYGVQPTRPVGRGPGQYVRTTADNRNVRSYDPLTGRDRGGSRPGLSKYNSAKVPDVLGGTDEWFIQDLSALASTNPGTPAVQTSLSGRVVYLLAVSQGTVKYMFPGENVWYVPANVTGETPALNISGLVRSAPNNQKMFFVDGTNYVWFDPPANQIKLWTPNAGSLPTGGPGETARLICTWRGRTTLAGVLKDPQNFFMSKLGDPFDFNYQPSPITKTQAVVANLSPAGLIGDVINGLCPYTDDVLIFFGDHTIHALRGDPADGGSVDLVSDITGAAFGEAWCKDPFGNVYFFGNKPSVWRMTGTNQPQRISDPIEPLLAGIDTGHNVIRLEWNEPEQAVYVWVTPADAPAQATHFVWEARSGSWNKDRYGNTNHNPVACCTYDGNLPSDRAVVIGSWDGYVRFLDKTATTDDGTAIESYVLIGPIMTLDFHDMMLKEIQTTLGESSGQVTWEVLAGNTAEQALAAASRQSGTAGPGLNSTQPIQVSGHAIYIKISSTNRWAMEAIRSKFGPRGKVRQRRPKI